MRKWSEATDRLANMLVAVPGGGNGFPGGVLVFAENFVLCVAAAVDSRRCCCLNAPPTTTLVIVRTEAAPPREETNDCSTETKFPPRQKKGRRERLPEEHARVPCPRACVRACVASPVLVFIDSLCAATWHDNMTRKRYQNRGHREVRTPIPRRVDTPDTRGVLLVAAATHRQRELFFVLAQSEYVCCWVCGCVVVVVVVVVVVAAAVVVVALIHQSQISD